MNALYYDAIVIAACYGKPTFFIIFTANPQWPEIEWELYPGQDVKDCLDLVACVFKLKKRVLLDDIFKY
jgi:hypothetical protein